MNDVPGDGDKTGDGTGTGTGTGTGSGTSTAPDSVRAQYMYDGYLNSEVIKVQSSTDANGKIKIMGIEIGEYRAHHFYDVTAVRYFCTYSQGCGNVCRYSDQKVEVISVVESKDPPTPNNP